MPSCVNHPYNEPVGPLILLQGYGISENGFLPQKHPLDRLPDPMYTPWEDILSRLPEILKSKKIRESIDELDILDTQGLRTDEEWRRAYVVLSFLTHGYIWGGDTASETLPPAISVPYLQVSEQLQLPPVATYAALNLWNFTTPGHDFADVDNLKALHTFSGTEDESWFFVLSVAMECQGARVIPVMLGAIEAIPHHDYQTIANSLEELRSCIEKMGQLLDRMQEKCDPMVFYHQIRPYLAGSKNMEHAGLPNGIFYDEGNGRGSWKQLRGGSNGQSSLIQFLDIVLGVEHISPQKGKSDQSGYDVSTKVDSMDSMDSMDSKMDSKMDPTSISFHEEVRSYMPEPHRKFLQHVSRMDSLRDFALRPVRSDEQRRMQQSFQAATMALAEFRSKHMQMVTRYIVVPSRKLRETATVNLATACSGSSVGQNVVLTGTGGTDLIPFLKQTREETLLAGRYPREAVR